MGRLGRCGHGTWQCRRADSGGTLGHGACVACQRPGGPADRAGQPPHTAPGPGKEQTAEQGKDCAWVAVLRWPGSRSKPPLRALPQAIASPFRFERLLRDLDPVPYIFSRVAAPPEEPQHTVADPSIIPAPAPAVESKASAAQVAERVRGRVQALLGPEVRLHGVCLASSAHRPPTTGRPLLLHVLPNACRCLIASR